MAGLVLHRLVQRDLRSVLSYYTEEGGQELADQFFREFERLVGDVAKNPKRFHPIYGQLRRANFHRFPYHLLYRELEDVVRVLVLRHHRRNPEYGIERK